MKSYTITVNGTAYDVTVEETEGGQAAAPAAAPKAAPKKAPKAAPKAAAPAGGGSIKVNASVPGKVVSIAAKIGQTLKAGDTVVVLESMKMEIPVVAPQDGTVASIDINEGASVESGDTLATMN